MPFTLVRLRKKWIILYMIDTTLLTKVVMYQPTNKTTMQMPNSRPVVRCSSAQLMP